MEWRTPKPEDEQPPFKLIFNDLSHTEAKVSDRREWNEFNKYCAECKAVESQYNGKPYLGSIIKSDHCRIYKQCLIKINYYPSECPICHEIYTVKIDYKDGQIGLLIRGGNVINWSVVPCDVEDDSYHSCSWHYMVDNYRLFIIDKHRERQLHVLNHEIIDKYRTNAPYIFKLKSGGIIAGFRSYSNNYSIVFVDGSGQIVPHDTLTGTEHKYISSDFPKDWPYVFENEYFRATLCEDYIVQYTSLRPTSKITKPAIS
jgi:hypothetical protein